MASHFSLLPIRVCAGGVRSILPTKFRQYSSSTRKPPSPSGSAASKFGLPLLSAADHVTRTRFAADMLEKLDQEPDLIHRIVFSDEGNFWPTNAGSGSNVNAHRSVGANSNVHGHGRKKGSKKLYAESPPLPSIAWCGMTTREVIGPYFFNAHVTESSYLSMLRKYFLPQLMTRHRRPLSATWFQQDGAPPHRSRSVLALLGASFGPRLISYGVPSPPGLRWPPRSQDLTPLDYFFWDYMKAKMASAYKPRDHTNLRECLALEMESIDPEVLNRFVNQEFVRRLKRCVEVGGKRFELDPVTVTATLTEPKDSSTRTKDD